MTTFVESFVTTIADTATKVAKKSRALPAKKLLKALGDKKHILVTTHMYPDPDAIASSHAMGYLLRAKLPKDAVVTVALKGISPCGINSGFATLSNAEFVEWPGDDRLAEFDAIVLTDVQPGFSTSPLPAGLMPTAIVDHHRSRGRNASIAFRDVRIDVGSSSSIIFSYLHELGLEISPSLAAMLLYAIESDLAGVAGHPGELDNMAMSNLTLIADTRKLYQMRYTALPAEFYVNFARGISEAQYAGKVLGTFLGAVDSPAMPAVVADFLLRFAGITWVLVGALHNGRLIISLRTSEPKVSAGEMMRKLVCRIGEGGGHRTKAGGMVPLANGSPAEIDRIRKLLRRRLLKLTGMPQDTRFTKLVATPAV